MADKVLGAEEAELAQLAEDEKDWETAVELWQSALDAGRGSDNADEYTRRLWMAVSKFEAVQRRTWADSYEIKPLPPTTTKEEEEEED